LVAVIQDIQASRKDIEFVAMVIGTDEDPQNISNQIEQLEEANVLVFRTAAEAVEYISLKFSQRTVNQFPSVNVEQLKQPLAGINVGLESFYESLISQGVQAVHVEWRPPAGGNEKLAALLAKMKK
jgi:FdrA protein